MMKTITKEELQKKINHKEDFILLDVREPEEHKEFNLGGILLPLGNIQNMDIKPIEQYRNKQVIVYCRSGKRSLNACLILNQLGFVDVLNLEGGVLAWQ